MIFTDRKDGNIVWDGMIKPIPKPGNKKKSSKIKNKSRVRLHDLEKPEKTHCRFCGLDDDGTCYYHHTEDPFLKMKYGSGVGRKVDDNLTVWAHHVCGTEMSKKPDPDDSNEQKLLWMNGWYRGIIETHLV